MGALRRIRFVDSHTGGEPTRVIVNGGPDLDGATMETRRADFAARFDAFRSAVVNEPRGSDVLVGALLTEPVSLDSVAGVIFFNNVGTLWMCGHGTIGVVETLRHLGRVEPGPIGLDTPVGRVVATLHESGDVSFENVPSYRHRTAVPVRLASGQTVTGDIAWGGNWFYLCQDHGQVLELSRAAALTEFCWQVREALEREGVTGAEGGLIDHIELLGPSAHPGVLAKNFVLCPGGAYDRSPCGTGTSAKLACLFEDGKIAEGEEIVLESITGSVFRGKVRKPLPLGAQREGEGVGDGGSGSRSNGVIPTVTGRAWVTAEGDLLLDRSDPIRDGLPTPLRGT
ncbi:MAG: proline racemase family protein [Armatimonadetes bacterium]|nr:proline racemase family protein [Armatimonadota bacterium]